MTKPQMQLYFLCWLISSCGPVAESFFMPTFTMGKPLATVTSYTIQTQMCGERPGYDAPCCNKGLGANFLMAGVGFSFIFSWVLMLLVAIFFIVGGPTYTEVCRYFDSHDPNDIKFIADAVQQNFNLSGTLYRKPNVEFNIVGVLNDCKDDKAVYKAMKLDYLFNLSEIINVNDIDAEIDKVASQNITIPEVTLIGADLRKRIDDFGKAGLDNINFASFDEQTSKKLTVANLTQVAESIDTQAASLTGRIKIILNDYANELRMLDRNYVRNMSMNVKLLNDSLRSLKKHTNLPIQTNALIASLNSSQNKFNTERNTLVKNLVKNMTDSMKRTTKDNVNSLIYEVENNVGHCKPVYDSIYLATDALCVTVLNPFNSLWFSWGWCLFFFIPCIIFAVKLAGLYRREEEYSEKDFDDTNFSMYGGSTPDTIPLTSMEGRHRGQGYHPGVANSGYHPHDDSRHRGHSNGYGPTPSPNDFHFPGSMDAPPPAYHGGSHVSYPTKHDRDHDLPRYEHHQRHKHPMRY